MAGHHLALVVGGSADPRGEDAQVAESGGVRSPRADAHTLTLFGELSHGSAYVLEAEIEHLCAAGIAALTLDLSRLVEIDWAGTRVIAFRHGWCRRRGCELSLVPGAPQVQRVFDREGLTAHLPFLRAGEQPSPEPLRLATEAPTERELYVTPV